MGLMDFIKKQFIDVIQWTEEEDGVLAWRFPMAGMEIQNACNVINCTGDSHCSVISRANGK